MEKENQELKNKFLQGVQTGLQHTKLFFPVKGLHMDYQYSEFKTYDKGYKDGYNEGFDTGAKYGLDCAPKNAGLS